MLLYFSVKLVEGSFARLVNTDDDFDVENMFPLQVGSEVMAYYL